LPQGDRLVRKMCALSLRKGLHYCEIDRRIYFLDVQYDRYFCLTGSLREAFLAFVASEGIAIISPPLALLVEKGILVRETPYFDGSCSCQHPPSRSEINLNEAASHSRWLTMQASLSILRAKRILRRYGLQVTLAHAASAANAVNSSEGKPIDVSPICRAFEKSRRYISSLDQCLAHSLALALFLYRREIRPELVLGVSAYPFSAHCWVQLDKAVLNDSVEHVSAFTPIFAI